MTKLFVGYALAIGVWIGTLGFFLLAMSGADALPGEDFWFIVALFSLGAILIVLPIFLFVWSVRAIRKDSLPKAGLGITILAGLHLVFLIFMVGKILLYYSELRSDALREELRHKEEEIQKI